MDHNANGEKPGPQSIFSKRSGIQDPLLRPDSRPDSNNADPADLLEGATPEISAGAGEAPSIPAGVLVTEPSAPGIERKPRKGNDPTRPVKPKRHLDRARRRQKNYLEERRDKKRQRVLQQRIRVILKLCLAVGLSFLVWQAARSPLWRFDQPRFTLSDAHLIQSQQVAPWVQEVVGKPIYAIDTGKMAGKIQRSFDIASHVVVRRQLFPARLTIMILEKQAWAEIYATDPNPRPPSKEHSSPEADSKPSPKAVPRPYGLMVPGGIISLSQYHYQPEIYAGHSLEKLLVKPKTVFTQAYLNQLHVLAWQAHQIPGLHLMNVDVRNPNRVIFNFQELPVMLGSLNNTAEERLARLIPLIPKIQEFREDMESVDLQWEEQVTFHQKPNAKLDFPKPEQPQG